MEDLYHYGIKGQKKGLRRYQYANKTYTPAGNERYRPKKGNMFVNTTMGLGAAYYLGTLYKRTRLIQNTTHIATMTLSQVSKKAVATGAAVCASVSNIPLSVLIVGGATAIAVGSLFVTDIIDAFDD